MDNKRIIDASNINTQIIVGKLDVLTEKVHSIDITVAKQEVNLEHHMKRSDELEKQHDILAGKVLPIVDRDRALKYIFSISSGTLVLMNIGYIIYRVYQSVHHAS